MNLRNLEYQLNRPPVDHSTMNLRELRLQNFRKYEDETFTFHKQFTVLIGNNGAGKTTVLDAAAIMLGTYFQGSGLKTAHGSIKKDDARLIIREKADQVFYEPQKDVFLKARSLHKGNQVNWIRKIGDRGGKAKDIIACGKEDRKRISDGDDYGVPMLLYYGAGRLWNKHRNIETEKPGSQLDAYRYCLDPVSDQKAFEKWFKKLSYKSLQKNKDISALKAVQSAVMICIPGAQEFYFDTDEEQIIIKLEDGLMPFNFLSDGYRNMIAMVADIAYRAVRVNPHWEEQAPEKTSGVVLIDEIDLHLHPKWQRRVVQDLQNAFKEMQFIATTHSPFIIQSLDEGEVIDLNRSSQQQTENQTDEIAAPAPQKPYTGRSIEDIVEDLMGIDLPQRSERQQRMADVAKKYYKLLQEAPSASGVQLEELKVKLDELSAPFSDNIAYHSFLEMKRIAAGLGESNSTEDIE